MSKAKKIVIAVTGASGSIYAQRLLFHLKKYSLEYSELSIVFSDNAKEVWQHELTDEAMLDIDCKVYDSKDFNAPFASGSANYDTMIICPASMGMVGRIANGISDDLISRAADVMLKERKQLVVVPRETPFNLIHLRNMTSLVEAGAIIIPASPSFYSLPNTIEELVDTVVYRVLNILGIDTDSFSWGQ